MLYVELEATLDERLRRNEGEFRLAQKPSRRDVATSRRILLQNDTDDQLNSAGRFDGRQDWLRIENTHLPPAKAAEQVIRRFALPRAAAPAG